MESITVYVNTLIHDSDGPLDRLWKKGGFTLLESPCVWPIEFVSELYRLYC